MAGFDAGECSQVPVVAFRGDRNGVRRLPCGLNPGVEARLR